jgi:hypothetical protein
MKRMIAEDIVKGVSKDSRPGQREEPKQRVLLGGDSILLSSADALSSSAVGSPLAPQTPGRLEKFLQVDTTTERAG